MVNIRLIIITKMTARDSTIEKLFSADFVISLDWERKESFGKY